MSFFRLGLRAASLRRPVLDVSRHRINNIWRFGYASSSGLTKEVIQKRVLDVLHGFEKIDSTKLTPASSFSKDLGLDSLDSVEVVMAIEEEFSIEIPDAEADEIQTVQQAIDYITKTSEAR